jgi:hypothetical protein
LLFLLLRGAHREPPLPALALHFFVIHLSTPTAQTLLRRRQITR